ncbi:hypothetical protein GUJ93_ZPchr0007g6335 [Zizania palustris]|uniref:Uncharacterized protein n=1 Tax=Zizania palustris TaxID=103762 RepID=A0A8J5TDU7_ZIZPA|nr:hypothetical protein GUJ93_ZPchr0007g6335 [Zizania palustris]
MSGNFRADRVARNSSHPTEPVDGNHQSPPPRPPPAANGVEAEPAFRPMAPQPLRVATPSKCSAVPVVFGRQRLPLLVAFPRGAGASCSAVQESSASTAATVSEKKDATDGKKEATAEAKPAAKTPAKPKKAAVKPLPEMMQEDIIPPLKAALEAEVDVSQVELSFNDNRLEGSFVKDEVPYYFWAFFPNGDLTGPKGFALSSYGTEVSTIEPFLIDEKRANAKYVVFWVYKRLAGQGIIPVWKEEEGEVEGAE